MKSAVLNELNYEIINILDMKNKTSKKHKRKAFFILLVVRRLLKWYVNIERFHYDPICKFKEGQAIKLNWKAWAYFGDDQFYKVEHKMHFCKIDADNVVNTLEGDTWNLYWLCAG
jgi:hypothetical protein